MNLNVLINLDNAAFEYLESELQFCFNQIVTKISNNSGNIVDSNGNNVGNFKITKD